MNHPTVTSFLSLEGAEASEGHHGAPARPLATRREAS
jgi:hypothetical protein